MRARDTHTRAITMLIVWVLAGLASQDASASAAPSELRRLPDRLRDDRALARRASEGPHALFRLVNLEFARAVCERFELAIESMPSVNLHGDAHVEQYAVTRDAAGLNDFDDSSTGPAFLDLTRFTASLLIASQERGWQDGSESIVDAFFDGYRRALRDPAVDVPEPDIARRIRDRFDSDAATFLTWCESVMRPLPASRGGEILAGYERYVARMLERRPDLDSAFFRLKALGSHQLGVGSARDVKVLGRIEGPTPASDDDIILEGKELRDLSPIECITARRGDALRVVLSQRRISNRRDPFLAVIPRGTDEAADDPPFWVQSWVPEYAEVDIDETLESPDDLRSIAFDVGIQLGRGHPNEIATPFDVDLRRTLHLLVDRHETAVVGVARELALEVSELWRSTWGDP